MSAPGTKDASRFPRETSVPFLWVLLLGLGYLLIEMVLIQKFAIFLTSPIWALTVVLGTMLVSSGIGVHFSARLRGGAAAAIPFVALFALIGASYAGYGGILDAAMALPFSARVALACILIAPLGFAMGMPFPHGMDVAKRALSERHAGLFFGINGAFGAVAAPLAFILSQIAGFQLTLLVGGGAYAACLLLLPLFAERDQRTDDRTLDASDATDPTPCR